MFRPGLLDEIKQLSMDDLLTVREFLIQEVQQKLRPDEFESLKRSLGMSNDAPTDEEIKEDYISYLREKYK